MNRGPSPLLEEIKLTSVVCFLYFLTGHFGLYLALPPGFATVVWPASGIALGFLICYGNRALFGVVLGSLLINSISKDLVWTPSLVAMIVAFGATLQAFVGLQILRLGKELPVQFLKPKSIIYFFAFVAPVSCFVSTTIGSTALFFADKIIPEELSINWLTWFLGDALGVMLFTPFTLLIIKRKDKEWQDRVKYLLPSFGLSLTVFMLIFFYGSTREREKVESRSRKDASEVRLLVQTKMLQFERFVVGVKALYQSNNPVTYEDHQEFLAETSAGITGLAGVAWVPRIRGRDIPAYSVWLAEQGLNDFRLRDLDSNPILPINPDQVYYPLTFFTRKDLKGARGVDLGLDPKRLSGMLKAEETLKPYSVASIPFLLRKGHLHIDGSILIQPILKKSQSGDRPDVPGFLYFGLHPKQAFAEALHRAEELCLDLEIRNANSDIVISTLDDGHKTPKNAVALLNENILGWQGDQWRIRISPKQTYVAKNRSWDTWAILIIGLAFCAAIQVFILLITGSHYKVSVQVTERTRELDDSRKNLMLARDEAIKANDAKGIFLANMSHEIRTPLNGIIGITKLLSATSLSSKQRRWLEYLEVSNRGLMMLINDILDLSKIEAGAITLQSEAFEPRRVVREAVETLSALAEAKDLAIRITFDPNIPQFIQGDAFRIRQVILNIVSNAIKFTDKGTIVVEVSTLSQTQPAKWQITTIDSGIGMSAEVLSRIFHIFTQGNDSVQQGARGSGLGLTISRDIVELMGGSLEVESTEGEGSIFCVTLPLEPASPEPGRDLASAPTFEIAEERRRAFKVLLVEDNEVNRIVALGLLHEIGLEADVAEDGEAAVKAARKGAYDIILMDIHMPLMNGLEATKAIRKLPIKRAFIIALTADATSKERDVCLEAGMDAFISKPIDYLVLNELIKSQFENRVAKGFDIEALRKKFEGIEMILIQTLNAYLPTFRDIKNQIEHFTKLLDLKSTRLLLHSLKGMILNFPGAKLHDELSNLEAHFQADRVEKEAWAQLETALAHIETANLELEALLTELMSR